jgi:hypothetical protein
MIHQDETRGDDNSALPRRMLAHRTSRYEPNSAMRDVRSMYGLTVLVVPPLHVLMGERGREHLGPRQVHRFYCSGLTRSVERVNDPFKARRENACPL